MPETFAVQAAACTSCGHQHTTADMGYICVGCPCPLTPGKTADTIAETVAAANAVDPNGAPAWLAALCDPQGRPEEIRTPFPIEDDGARYAAATDKHCLIAVRGVYAMRPTTPAFLESVRSVFTSPIETKTIAFERFTAWAAKGMEGDTPACPKCNGTRRVKCGECDGTGEVECECSCGDEHTADCDECDVRNEVRCDCLPAERVVLGRIGDKVVNLALFARYVPHLTPSDEVRVGGTADPNSSAHFWTDDWRVIVMPRGQVSAERLAAAEDL